MQPAPDNPKIQVILRFLGAALAAEGLWFGVVRYFWPPSWHHEFLHGGLPFVFMSVALFDMRIRDRGFKARLVNAAKYLSICLVFFGIDLAAAGFGSLFSSERNGVFAVVAVLLGVAVFALACLAYRRSKNHGEQ